MNQPAKRKTDADATERISDATELFCGKLLFCPASKFAGRAAPAENRRSAEFSSLSTVKRRSRMTMLRGMIPTARARVLISSE
jgi:hypothetical protein